MENRDNRSDQSRRVDEPQRSAAEQTAEAAPKNRPAPHFVDPYDMHGEPQPEEPGYGHGV